MTELISVGIPVYNCERFLDESLNSIVNQTYQNLEIIIVDNNSTDGTKKIIEKFAQKDNRIVYKKNYTTLFMSENFNECFYLAKGKYFMWSACDDIWDKTFIEKAVQILEDRSELIAVSCDEYRIDDNGNIINFKDASDDIYTIQKVNNYQIIEPPKWSKYYSLYRRRNLENTRLNLKIIPERILQTEIAVQGPRAHIKEKLLKKRVVFKNKEITKRDSENINLFCTKSSRELIRAIDLSQISLDQKLNYKNYIKRILLNWSYFRNCLCKENNLTINELETYIDNNIMDLSKPLLKPLPKQPSPFPFSPTITNPEPIKKNLKKRKKKKNFTKIIPKRNRRLK